MTRRPDGTAYARTDGARAVGGSGYGRVMADKLTRQAASDALPTWRFLLQRMHLTVQASDVATAFDFVARVGAVAAPLGRQPDLDVRGTVVHLAVSTEPAGGVSDADIAVGRAVDSVVAEMGLTSQPGTLTVVEIAIDAMDIDAVRPFWDAVLGWDVIARDDVQDPLRLGPADRDVGVADATGRLGRHSQVHEGAAEVEVGLPAQGRRHGADPRDEVEGRRDVGRLHREVHPLEQEPPRGEGVGRRLSGQLVGHDPTVVRCADARALTARVCRRAGSSGHRAAPSCRGPRAAARGRARPARCAPRRGAASPPLPRPSPSPRGSG